MSTISAAVLIAQVQRNAAEDASEDRQLGQRIDQEGFDRFIDARQEAAAAKEASAEANDKVHDAEGVLSIIPVFGQGIGTMVTMDKEDRKNLVGFIPVYGPAIRAGMESYDQLKDSGMLNGVPTPDGPFEGADRGVVRDQDAIAGKADIAAEVNKKGSEAGADMQKSGRDLIREMLDVGKEGLKLEADRIRALLEGKG